MDYKEEQSIEIEALESIYSEELSIISTDPYIFDVSVSASNEDSRDEHKVNLSVDIRFTYVDNYPDDIPLTEIRNQSDHITGERIDKIQNDLQEEATNNIGTVMVFTLVSLVQEMLLIFIDEIKNEFELEKQRKLEEERKADEIKYKGTPVTLENFLAWKIRFDEEMRAAGKRKITDENKIKKLTGRQLFERDSTLNESDVQFLTSDVGGGVKVDESLFQDLDGLDLEDEDFDS